LSLALICNTGYAGSGEQWFQYSILPQNNANAKLAHSIFNELLAAHPYKVKGKSPRLFVVYSRLGPWSAALPDGSILFSEAAIMHARKGGRRHVKHKLAFVLAHEIELMKTKNFWHRQYYSIIGSSKQVSDELQREVTSSEGEFEQLVKDEARITRKVLMDLSSLGYEVAEIARDKTFFTAWLKSAWQPACVNLGKILRAVPSSKSIPTSLARLCTEKTKFIKTRYTQFKKLIANQVLFETALQAYIAGKYNLARTYFAKYSLEFPHAKAYFYIGSSYLHEALDHRRNFVELGGYHKNVYVYPIIFDSTPTINKLYKPILGLDTKSGNEFNVEKKVLAYKEKLNYSISLAVKFFEKALALDHKYKSAYINLIAAYLTVNDRTKANKVLFSKYINRFGSDELTSLYSGILHASFRRYNKARQDFSRLTQAHDPVIAALAYINLAQVYQTEKKTDQAERVWDKLKLAYAGKSDIVIAAMTNPIKFRRSSTFEINPKLVISKFKPGSNTDKKLIATKSRFRLPVDVLTTQLIFYYAADGGRVLLNSDGYVYAAWQDRVSANSRNKWINKSEKYLIKKLGAPNKVMSVMKGRLLVYTELNVAFHTQAGKVKRWIRFPQDYQVN